MTTTEPGSGGISRRDMIKGSVVAGGLIWAAPLLLTGKAAAQVADIPCCEDGLMHFVVNIPSLTGINCGSISCLDNLDFIDDTFDCADDPDIESCLPSLITVDSFESGNDGSAMITLRPGVTLIAAAVKESSRCFIALCTCLPTGDETPEPGEGPTDTSCPNCEQAQGDDGPDFDPVPGPPDTGDCDPVAATLADPNRVWVEEIVDPDPPDPDNPTMVQRIHVAADPLTQVELAICLAPEATGLCP